MKAEIGTIRKHTVNLTLTMEEAVALYAIMSNVGGHYENSLRSYTNLFYNELDTIMATGCHNKAIPAYEYGLMGLIKASVEYGGKNAVELCKTAAKQIESRLE